jgi:hypothetical protein
MTEDEIYLYHMAIDFLAKCSLRQPASLKAIRERLVNEANKSRDEDRDATLCLSNVLLAYEQPGE